MKHTKTFYNKFGKDLISQIDNGLSGDNLRAYLNGANIDTTNPMSPIRWNEFRPNQLCVTVRGKTTYHNV